LRWISIKCEEKEKDKKFLLITFCSMPVQRYESQNLGSMLLVILHWKGKLMNADWCMMG
jgi:hypothetical protein